MHDRPNLDELLGAIEAFLRADVLPAARGRPRYHLHVALSLLAIARRELAGGPQPRIDEAAGLRALGVAGADDAADDAALRAANVRLSAAIRAGDFDRGPARAALLAHLRSVTEDKLRVANPSFLERVRQP